jgi:hypothetical protein
MVERRVLRLLERHRLVVLLECVEQTTDRIFSRLQPISVRLDLEVLSLELDHGVGHVLAAEEEVLLLVVLRRRSMECVVQRLEPVVLEQLDLLVELDHGVGYVREAMEEVILRVVRVMGMLLDIGSLMKEMRMMRI